MKTRHRQISSSAWLTLKLAVNKFIRIDGTEWAGAFAFNAFFALFPLIVLLVTIASFVVARETAGEKVIAYIENYIPISGDMQHRIFDTVAGVILARKQASMAALILLSWTALQCFATLVSATNRAWGTEAINWWRLPLKSLALLGTTGGAVFLGITTPVLVKIAKDRIFPVHDFRSWVYDLGSLAVPVLVMVLGLSLFYMLAPRRKMRFSEVWPAALIATALLQAADTLFIIYLKNYATLNAVYGTFGGIMALQLWTYLSGCIFIFGACLCAVQSEERSAQVKTSMT